ncbi:MAG TPA: protein kinase, partial [Gemmatimonadales bacterium]|nr:protein kinase [Gemmatimonadales bacterium]
KEIELTANLQHPHILPLFDSGEADGLLYYVMPYVEGEALRARLERERQLPVADAVRIASDVADALAYAHRHGVVHRDIKPENILLHDGRPLVADFGIALAVEQAGGERMTQTGLSLGTPQYMSPEQAMGERVVDQRTDIYALGAVTYEMLAGEPPFAGASAQAIVAKVITEEPPALTVHRRSVPDYLEAAVLTALEKLPADRFSTADQFAAALQPPAAAAARTAARRGARGQRGRARRLPWWTAGLGAGLVLAAAAAGAYALGHHAGARGAAPLAFGRAVQVTAQPGLEILPAISPDGRSVAYAAGTSTAFRLFVRPVAGGRAIPLTDDSTAVETGPQWSADGTRVLFLARGGVFSAPAGGGTARPELPAPRGSPVTWAGWAPDGARLAYVVADSLFLRDTAGTSRRLATFLEPALCAWSPNGALIACASGNATFTTPGVRFGNLSPGWIVVCRVDDGSLATVTDRHSLNHSPAWSPDGRWLYYVSNRLGPRDIFAQRITPRGEATGAPLRLTVGLDAQSISLSPDGKRLAYSVFAATGNIWSLPLPRPTAAPVTAAGAKPVTFGNQIVENVRVSPDDRWLVFDSNLGGNADIYRVSLAGGEPERLTTDPADDFAPDLSADGRAIAFHSWRA